MSSKNELVVKNKQILDFYSNHPSLDFEKTNLIMIHFLESLFNHLSQDLGKNINSQLLTFMNQNKNQLKDVKEQLSLFVQSSNKKQEESVNNFLTQLSSWKSSYLKEIREIIEKNHLLSHEKINTVLEKNNSSMLDKTTLLLNDVVPKTNKGLQDQINFLLKDFHNQIKDDTSKILTSSKKENNLQDFLTTFDSKYNTLLQGVQQPLFAVLSSSEERLTKSLEGIKESNNQSLLNQKPVLDELSNFLGKYNMSSNKGKYGEQNLLTILTSMYPSGEIQNTTGMTASGDFILRRQDKPTIMFENKEYKGNIDKDEVGKFIRDVDNLKLNGIFLSQFSGISFKQNYQIDIHKGNILIYVQNCQYDNDKIRIAIDIIDYLSDKIKYVNSDELNEISKELLDDINLEYQSFINQKEILTSTLKEFHKKINSQIDDIRLPSLDKYLESKYASVRKKTFICNICNEFEGINKQSLSAHKRGCKKKQLLSSNNS